MIRILIADSRIIFQLGLVQALEKATNVEIVCICSCGKETVDKSFELKPDLILLDSNITAFDCFEVIKYVKQLSPKVRITLITPCQISDEESLRFLALELDGYITDDVDPVHLIDFINDIAAGKRSLSPVLGLTLLEKFEVSQKKETALSHIRLTNREIEILLMVAKGLTNHEISEKLYISKNTVKAHLSDIMKKTNSPNRQRAALFAVEKGIISRFELNKP